MGMTDTESVNQILLRLKELERRLSRLEPVEESPRVCTADGPAASQPVLPARSDGRLWGAFGGVAKGVLGLAGAYLLRAGAEAGWLPSFAGILAGLAYALAWIAAAGRTAKPNRSASTIYALVSSLIFVGIVWESAAASALLAQPMAALFVVVYLCAGEAVAWMCDRREIAAITTASAVVLSLGLLIATHNLIPFDISLLCATAAGEFAACRGKWLGRRWVAALGADFAICLTVWIFTRSAVLPEGYAPFGQFSLLAVQLALVLVYLASMAYRTLAARTLVTAFEIRQNAVALGLFILGQAALAPASRLRLITGILCFLVAKGSYTTSILQGRKGAQRNSLAYGIFGLALQIAALLIVVPAWPRMVAFCGLAFAATQLGKREQQPALQLQAPVFLLAAALASGVIWIPAQSFLALIVPHAPRLGAMLLTTAATALVYQLAGASHTGKSRNAPLACAALVAWSVLGLGAIGIKALFGSLTLATSLRIGLIGLAAVGSARVGMRSRASQDRPEWVWLSYPLMLYGAWRIVVEDLLSGRPAATALSLLFYGGALLLLTRILRSRHPAIVDSH
jgi:hypothetical protein